MSRVILVLSDALRHAVAKDNIGFLGNLVEKKLASLYKVIGQLPSMSRQCTKRFTQGLHPMGMDQHGETYGSDSPEYPNHAIQQDPQLAPFVMEWKQHGYTVLVI